MRSKSVVYVYLDGSRTQLTLARDFVYVNLSEECVIIGERECDAAIAELGVMVERVSNGSAIYQVADDGRLERDSLSPRLKMYIQDLRPIYNFPGGHTGIMIDEILVQPKAGVSKARLEEEIRRFGFHIFRSENSGKMHVLHRDSAEHRGNPSLDKVALALYESGFFEVARPVFLINVRFADSGRRLRQQ